MYHSSSPSACTVGHSTGSCSRARAEGGSSWCAGWTVHLLFKHRCYSGCSRAGKSPIPDQDSESSIRKPVRIGIPYSSVDQFLHVNDVPAERRCAAAHGRERGRERGRHPRPAQALLGLWSTHGIFLRRRGRTVLSTVHVPGGGVGAAAAHAAVYGVRRAAPRRVSLVS